MPVAELLRSAHESLPSLFNLEWQNAQLDDDVRLLLAVLSYENRPYTVERLAAIASIGQLKIVASLSSLPFVQWDGTSARFVSEAFRRFVSDRLSELRPGVNQLFIDYLLRDPESDEALKYLPGFFTSADKLTELVAYLSPERFASLYRRSPSLESVQLQARQAVDASRQLHRDADVLRFTLQQATIAELAQAESATSEVCALTALKDVDAALALAQAEMQVNSRFRLLAAIEKTRREIGLPNDPGLLDSIKTLYSEIEPTAFGDRLTEVAADLFHSFPDLAIDLVSRGAGEGRGANAIDWAFAALAIQADLRTEEKDRQKAKEIRERIADPAARRLAAEAEMLLGDLSAVDAIAEAKRLESAGNQLYMLRRWMVGNSTREDAGDVFDYALQVAIRTTDYVVNAEVYRELATCLPHLKSYQALSHYCALIDGQQAAIEAAGPTEEYVRLQLTLARAHWRFDQSTSRNRYGEVYNAIVRIADLAAKSACLGHLVTSLRRIDPNRLLDTEYDLHSLAEQELWDGIDELLSQSAEHYDVVKGVIDALSPACPELALRLAAMLNTESRRDAANKRVIQVASSVPHVTGQFDSLRTAMLSIVDPAVRDEAVSDWIVAATRMARTTELRRAAASLALVAPNIGGAVSRARAAARIISTLVVVTTTDEHERMMANLETVVLEAWRGLEADAERCQVGYDLITIIAPHRPALAKTLVGEINDLKAQSGTLNVEAGTAAYLGLQLAIRTYAALVKRKLSSPDDMLRLKSSIERTGSAENQLSLWCDLALRHHTHSNLDERRAVVVDRIVPLLTALRRNNKDDWEEAVTRSASALLVGARPTFDVLISQIDAVRKDAAVDDAARFLLTGVPRGDPYERYPGAGFNIDFTTAQEIIQIIGRVDEDNLIYQRMSEVVDAACGNQYADQFNKNQRAELVRQLEELARERFPSNRFIKHAGYVIASDATINRLREPAKQIPTATLVQRAIAIPNVSDRVYVLGIIARVTRDSKSRRQVLDQAAAIAETLPVITERIDRFELLSDFMINVEPQRSRELLERAIRLTQSGVGETLEDRRLSLIDAMYRRDPKAAASIASTFKSEVPKTRAQSQLSFHRLKEVLASRHQSDEEPKAMHVSEWSRAAWAQLGALNARRTNPVPPERTMQFMEYAAAQPVTTAYPIFAWAIENAVRREGGTPEARKYLVPLFEACLRGAELALYSGFRNTNPVPLVLKESATALGAEFLVRDGEKRDGIEFVKTWLTEGRPEEIWIVDPYFTPSSLEAVLVITEAIDECAIQILTGKDAHRNVAGPYEDTYRAEWSRLSNDAPPATRIIIAGVQSSGKFPIHDRWWLSSGNGGLRFGTSHNGLGNRWSEISVIDEATAVRRLSELLPFFDQGVRQFEGEPLKYSTISL